MNNFSHLRSGWLADKPKDIQGMIYCFLNKLFLTSFSSPMSSIFLFFATDSRTFNEHLSITNSLKSFFVVFSRSGFRCEDLYVRDFFADSPLYVRFLEIFSWFSRWRRRAFEYAILRIGRHYGRWNEWGLLGRRREPIPPPHWCGPSLVLAQKSRIRPLFDNWKKANLAPWMKSSKERDRPEERNQKQKPILKRMKNLSK